MIQFLDAATGTATTAEMLISPAVLGKLESGAPLGQLLGTIGGFTILLFALTALCYYIDHLTMFGRCGARLELLKRINTKRTRTAYANLLDEAFRLMYQKGHDACMNNRASGEAFWKSWTDILTNLIGFGVYLALLSGRHAPSGVPGCRKHVGSVLPDIVFGLWLFGFLVLSHFGIPFHLSGNDPNTKNRPRHIPGTKRSNPGMNCILF